MIYISYQSEVGTDNIYLSIDNPLLMVLSSFARWLPIDNDDDDDEQVGSARKIYLQRILG
jgi:hypothetical protein